MTENSKIKIAVASGKGGTGKTLVSTNLFWTAQNAGFPVTLVDCDAEEPNVTEFVSGDVLSTDTVTQNIPVINPELCVFCGKCFNYCNYNAIVYLPANQFIKVVEDLCHDCGACKVACKFGAITEKEKQLGTVNSMYLNSHAELIEACADVGVYSPVPVIKKAIKEASNSYLALFDSPPGISCPFIATVENADYVILVTEPTPFGLNDLKLSVETLQQLKKTFGVIVNRAGLGNREVYDWLQQNKIPLLLEIPFEREIARIYSEGRLLAEEKPAYQLQFKQVLKAIEKSVKR
ncbi:MAG: ATP-binding protein [Prolixibacteraceae bacterium]|nr:ATP-binding protein [Prolixibacteraceae bacterium]